MSTKDRVFSRLFDGQEHDLKTNLTKEHKVALGLVQDLEYDLMSLQDQSGMLSYLAYDWHDEKFEEYRQAWMALDANDVYDQWDEHYAELENMKANDEQYVENEREFRNWS